MALMRSRFILVLAGFVFEIVSAALSVLYLRFLLPDSIVAALFPLFGMPALILSLIGVTLAAKRKGEFQ